MAKSPEEFIYNQEGKDESTSNEKEKELVWQAQSFDITIKYEPDLNAFRYERNGPNWKKGETFPSPIDPDWNVIAASMKPRLYTTVGLEELSELLQSEPLSERDIANALEFARKHTS